MPFVTLRLSPNPPGGETGWGWGTGLHQRDPQTVTLLATMATAQETHETTADALQKRTHPGSLRKGNPRDSGGWGWEARRPRSRRGQGRGRRPSCCKKLPHRAGPGRRARSGFRACRTLCSRQLVPSAAHTRVREEGTVSLIGKGRGAR